jgi:hypothetical protein
MADKPTVELIGQDGNAFMIMGLCRRAARKAGWSDAKWEKVQKEMMSGDYENVKNTAMKYFDVE